VDIGQGVCVIKRAYKHDRDLCQIFRPADSIHSIVERLNKYGDDEYIQVQGCKALADITARGGTSCEDGKR
jgi:hypothetical protein